MLAHVIQIPHQITAYTRSARLQVRLKKIILPSIPQSTLIEYLQVDTLPEGLHGLCKKHYCELSGVHNYALLEVYNWLHQPALVVQGARPKAGTRFLRHSPNPSLISKLLNQSAEMENDLTAKDAICYSCYRVHLSLINSTQSSDEQLEEFMQIWLEKVNDVNTSILTKSILQAVLVVRDNLLRQRAVLLPQVSQVFLKLETDDDSENSTTSTDSDESNEEDLEFEVVTECIMTK